MGGISLLQDLLDTIVERGASLAGIRNPSDDKVSVESLKQLADTLLSAKGEASGAALSAQFLSCFTELKEEQLPAFFETLAEFYDPSHQAISKAAADYAAIPSVENIVALEEAVQTPRRKLLRRVNLAPQGTVSLVHMREKLIPLLKQNAGLHRVDHDFLQLFKLWFNRGFLVLKQIDWSTQANILEKIIAYEAVHEIGDWNELRRRILPEDRRCFAFFHPSMPDDPLIFVEIALTAEIPNSIQSLLAEGREPLTAEDASTAVFYSISNCQQGLSGVSFGSFLIKRVAESLSRELPNLKNFVTLSPIPGFSSWLEQKAANSGEGDAATALNLLRQEDWLVSDESQKNVETLLKPLAVEYLVAAKNQFREPADPVARFHLGNGAVLHKIHNLANTTDKGLQYSAGMMVNYLYNLADIESNHEAYADNGVIAVSKEVRNISPSVFSGKK